MSGLSGYKIACMLVRATTVSGGLVANRTCNVENKPMQASYK